jgi:hypothetical protein
LVHCSECVVGTRFVVPDDETIIIIILLLSLSSLLSSSFSIIASPNDFKAVFIDSLSWLSEMGLQLINIA